MSHKDLASWLSFIEKAHIKNIDMGLSRVKRVFDVLHLDFFDSCVVTVAGTNGKGTTCRFIEQACEQSGLKTGVYSSPHIEHFNERIRVHSQEVSDDIICQAFAQVEHAASRADDGNAISLSYFEYATLSAFVIFAHSELDVCIIEVGLGGRLDATNIIDADIGVITSIGLDHQEYLGNTEDEIAKEKAGIIKPKQKVVVGYDKAHRSILEALTSKGQTSLMRGTDFGDSSYSHETADTQGRCHHAWFTLPLIDEQGKKVAGVSTIDLSASKIPTQNIATAIASLSFIAEYFATIKAQSAAKLRQIPFLQTLVASVQMPGRFEIVQRSPFTVLDVAHNEQACELLRKRIEQVRAEFYDKGMANTNVHIVIGMLKDKNIEQCINTLSGLGPKWYCVDLPTERGEKAARLHAHINALQAHAKPQANNVIAVNSFVKLEDAYAAAIDKATISDIILIVGSFILASEFKRLNNH